MAVRNFENKASKGRIPNDLGYLNLGNHMHGTAEGDWLSFYTLVADPHLRSDYDCFSFRPKEVNFNKYIFLIYNLLNFC
jgi:hypothetical protein